jgi:hypothetical protein
MDPRPRYQWWQQHVCMLVSGRCICSNCPSPSHPSSGHGSHQGNKRGGSSNQFIVASTCTKATKASLVRVLELMELENCHCESRISICIATRTVTSSGTCTFVTLLVALFVGHTAELTRGIRVFGMRMSRLEILLPISLHMGLSIPVQGARFRRIRCTMCRVWLKCLLSLLTLSCCVAQVKSAGCRMIRHCIASARTHLHLDNIVPLTAYKAAPSPLEPSLRTLDIFRLFSQVPLFLASSF